nr:MAG TPA: hypothetical protein [Caudoviricetes sp.]
MLINSHGQLKKLTSGCGVSFFNLYTKLGLVFCLGVYLLFFVWYIICSR